VMGAVAVTLFLGGWQIPGVGPQAYAAARGSGAFPAAAWWGLQLGSMVVFTVKTLLLVNVIIWIRWTLPRIRVDQMMNLCWKYLVPGAFACFLFTLLWQLLVGRAPAVELASGLLLSAGGALLLVLFLKQTRDNIRLVAGDKIDLSNW
jgi:NADH-quinone oxidoreductase subunit H